MLDKIFSFFTSIVNFILGLFGKEKFVDTPVTPEADVKKSETPVTKPGMVDRTDA